MDTAPLIQGIQYLIWQTLLSSYLLSLMLLPLLCCGSFFRAAFYQFSFCCWNGYQWHEIFLLLLVPTDIFRQFQVKVRNEQVSFIFYKYHEFVKKYYVNAAFLHCHVSYTCITGLVVSTCSTFFHYNVCQGNCFDTFNVYSQGQHTLVGLYTFYLVFYINEEQMEILAKYRVIMVSI